MQAVEDDVIKDASMDSTDLPEESKEASRPAVRGGGGWLGRPIQFLRDVRLEMKKVTWPSRSEVVSTTVVVMIAVVFFAAYLWGVDNVLELFFHQVEQALKF
jgi:preprotein translocase subunit SecE